MKRVSDDASTESIFGNTNGISLCRLSHPCREQKAARKKQEEEEKVARRKQVRSEKSRVWYGRRWLVRGALPVMNSGERWSWGASCEDEIARSWRFLLIGSLSYLCAEPRARVCILLNLRRLISPWHVIKCRGHHALKCSKLLPPNCALCLLGGGRIGNAGGRQEATIIRFSFRRV